MKPRLIKCLATGLVCAATLFCVSDLAAQPPMQYRIHWVDIPVNYDYLSLRGMNDYRIVTGYWRDDAVGLLNGFVYDLNDEANPVYYDLRTLLNIPAMWVENWGKHINNNGQGVAIVEDASGYRRGIWFDMATATWDFVPEPVGGTFSNRIHINNHGDIVIGFRKPNDEYNFYVYNPDPITGYAPIYSGIDAWVVTISDSGHVVGELSALNFIDERLFRWLPGDLEPEILDYNTFREFGSFNGLGEVVGTFWNSTIGGPGGQDSFEVFRYRSATDFDFLPVETGNAQGFNNSGDVAGNLDYGDLRFESFHSSGPDAFLYQDEWGVIPLDDVVVGVDAQFFKDATISFGGSFGSNLTNRDLTGFGSIFGQASITTTTGHGNNQTSTTERRSFILIPETLEPTPGITVTPTGGLVTTEAAGTDSFELVLDSEPAADVTIAFISSDLTEGNSDVPCLTFTSANWGTPQTVTVTGVDDPDIDGNIAYTIITAAATSTDPDYNGMNADDVQVTNQDDDSPPGGGAETYSSEDTPLDIPDNDPAGIDPPSTILANDHTIVNLTVTLDISHPRPSDLDVYLFGPNPADPPVQLFNFSGDNNVADFNGTSSLGLWTLEVYDTKKKKEGTLNSWSIMIETP